MEDKTRDFLEEVGLMKDQFDEFKKLWGETRSYIYNIQLTDQEVRDFLKEPHIRNSSVEMKVELFYDYVLSQGLCDVQE